MRSSSRRLMPRWRMCWRRRSRGRLDRGRRPPLRFARRQKATYPLDGIRGRSFDAKELPVVPFHGQADSLGELPIEVVKRIGIVLGPRWRHEVEDQIQAAVRHHTDLGLAFGIKARKRN